jgi:hypothetical protein
MAQQIQHGMHARSLSKMTCHVPLVAPTSTAQNPLFIPHIPSLHTIQMADMISSHKPLFHGQASSVVAHRPCSTHTTGCTALVYLTTSSLSALCKSLPLSLDKSFRSHSQMCAICLASPSLNHVQWWTAHDHALQIIIVTITIMIMIISIKMITHFQSGD